ncbi:AbfB domain-containing protein, partial [Streptomyces sp. NRRL S-350]|uniref:AbfB domain-containing protein n=1 Tax=Streptomyces sp. NRRL S-350 TaxID=1463902 RepID=UPI0004C264AF
SPAGDKADATWIVRTGLADSSCLSFESANKPGQFLHHSAFELYLNADNGGGTFAQDATFCPTPGNSGQGSSFRSANYPTKYLRHYAYTAYIASNGGSNSWDSATSWAADTSWLVAQPWS